MKRWACTLLLLGGAVSLAWGEEKPAPDKGSDSEAQLAKELDQLLRDHEKAYAEWLDKLRATKNAQERQKLFGENPTSKFASKVLSLAKRAPASAPGKKALLRVTQLTRTGPAADEALALMVKHHAKSEEMGDIALGARYGFGPKTESLLRTLIEESPHDSVKGKATFALATYLFRKDRNGKGSEEAEKLFDAVVKKYADIELGRGRTLGKSAKGALTEIRLLGIGKVAPDIEGEDVDGTKFKLSDYRGKVVVIDFWGDW